MLHLFGCSERAHHNRFPRWVKSWHPATARGAEPVSQRLPEMLDTTLQLYRDIARTHIQYLASLQQKPACAMEQLFTLLGHPGDLMDNHLRVIDNAFGQEDGNVMHLMHDQIRLLLLELMGMLVNGYHVGTRRR